MKKKKKKKVLKILDLLLFQETFYVYSVTDRFPLRPGNGFRFLFLAVRSAFILPAHEAYERGDFRLREEAKSWYLLCEIDQSSGVINVNFIFFNFLIVH